MIIGKLSIREGEWMAEMNYSDVVIVVRLSTVPRVLSDAADFVMDFILSHSHVVISTTNPDCDVCRLDFLIDR